MPVRRGVKAHFALNGAPEHVYYALLEADSPFVMARWVDQFPVRQDFKETPVVHMQEVAESIKAMLAQV